MSPGVATNTPEVWDLLRQKHPIEIPILPCPSLRVLLSITCCHMTLTSCQFSIPSPKVQPAALKSFPFSVLHIQVHLPTPICSSLRGVVDIRASGRAPVSVSKFVAGGSPHCTSEEQRGTSIGHSSHRSWGGIETLNREVSLNHHQAQSF